MHKDIYYTYKILFSTGHYYIGRRKCPKGCTPETDSYMGSPITHAEYWKKEKPKKIILNIFDNKNDYSIDEDKQLGNKWKSDIFCLNASPANGYSTSELIWCNDGIKDYMLPENKIPSNYSLGRLGTAAKGKKYYTNGKESKMFFENQQPEGWVLGNHNSAGVKNASYIYGAPNKNKIAYNNGTKTIYLNKGDKVPHGYIKGSTENFRKKRQVATKGRNNPRYGSRGEKWFNNGFVNKLYVPGKEPAGFVKGMIKHVK